MQGCTSGNIQDADQISQKVFRVTYAQEFTCYVQNEVVVVSDGAFQLGQILQNLLTLFRLQVGQEIL